MARNTAPAIAAAAESLLARDPEAVMLVQYIRTAQQLGFTLAEIGDRADLVEQLVESGAMAPGEDAHQFLPAAFVFLFAEQLRQKEHREAVAVGIAVVSLGIADEAGGSAHEGQRAVPVLLEPPHGEDLDEVAQVQARRRRVESHIEAHAPRRQGLAQGVEVRRVRDETAPLEIVEQGGIDGHE